MFKERSKKKSIDIYSMLYSYCDSSVAFETGKSWEAAWHVEAGVFHGPSLLCSGRPGGLEMLPPADVMLSPSTGFHELPF